VLGESQFAELLIKLVLSGFVSFDVLGEVCLDFLPTVFEEATVAPILVSYVQVSTISSPLLLESPHEECKND
jgi:hypothetical protein